MNTHDNVSALAQPQRIYLMVEALIELGIIQYQPDIEKIIGSGMGLDPDAPIEAWEILSWLSKPQQAEQYSAPLVCFEYFEGLDDIVQLFRGLLRIADLRPQFQAFGPVLDQEKNLGWGEIEINGHFRWWKAVTDYYGMPKLVYGRAQLICEDQKLNQHLWTALYGELRFFYFGTQKQATALSDLCGPRFYRTWI